jgi:hypothetical protein
MQCEKENGIVDGKRVEGLFEIGPDRRPLRIEVSFKRTLMREQLLDADVVNRAVRSPEPAQRVAEGAHDVLSRRNGDVALIAGTAEEDDD